VVAGYFIGFSSLGCRESVGGDMASAEPPTGSRGGVHGGGQGQNIACEIIHFWTLFAGEHLIVASFPKHPY